jgi:hypothetical protein
VPLPLADGDEIWLGRVVVRYAAPQLVAPPDLSAWTSAPGVSATTRRG